MDTIVAISTAPGIGGIGIIRMSGDNTFEILDKIFSPKNKQDISKIKGYSIKYGNIVDKSKDLIIDEVLVSYFKAPKSYTMENMCEINSHGGIILMRKILELCLENGAVIAEPGEFTKRAFLNGRIDLTQAESVIDIINSKTEKEANASIKQLEGQLSKDIHVIKDEIMSILVDVEASIDYPEYDVEEVTNNKAVNVLQSVKNKLINLEKTFKEGKIIKDGINVAIVGKPNAGKSSLLNAILREDRAIVTEYEGTTRDTIEEFINIDGIPVKIIDTAGIRNAKDEVEKIGIIKAKDIAKDADLVIAIFDSTKKLTDEDKEILDLVKNKKSIIILNKIDLNPIITEKDDEISKLNKKVINISALNKIGINEIYNEISSMFKLNEITTDNGTVITNIRHKEAIRKSILHINDCLEIINKKMPIDIIAIYIKEILEELGTITGENVTEDIIKSIFAKFCLGK